MKRYRGIIRKLGAVTLALAMTAAMVPVQVSAEEAAPAEQDVQQDEEQEVQQGSAGVENDEETESPVTPEMEEETADKMQETVESEAVQGENAQDENTQDENTQDAGANVLSEPEGENETSDSDTSASSDVNRPVIEGFTLMQQGQTLHEGDTVEVRVDTYDADSGIAAVEVYMEEGYETGTEGAWFEMEYSEELDCYVGTVTLERVGTGKVNIQSIRVVDNNSNYTEYSVYEENGAEYKYWFNTENDVNTIEPISIDFPSAGELVPPEEFGTFALTLPEEEPGSYLLRISFEREDGETDFTYLTWDNEEEAYLNYGLYMESGSYTVTSVTIERMGEDIEVLLDDEYSFTYQRDETEVPEDDTEAPVITSVSLDKNGQIVRSGDAVNITVKAEDNTELDEYAYVTFRATSDIIGATENVALAYSEEQQAYSGTFEITEETYPCEWYIWNIEVYDAAYNMAPYGDFLLDYPYYVQVYSGETFVNPVYDVSYAFYELSEDGEWTNSQNIETKVERRQTLKEAGIEFPSNTSDYEDFVFQGWVDQDGMPLTSDEEIVGSRYYLAYASYDQVKCNILYRYYTADGDTDYFEVSVNMPQGSTYGEVKEAVSEQEVPEQYPGMKFTGWKWVGDYEDDEVIDPFGSYFVADAVYDKAPAQVAYSYIDNSGNWKTVTEMFIFDKDATYKELRTAAAEYMPEDMSEEYSFAGWEPDTEIPDTDEVIDEYIGRSYRQDAKYEGKNVILIDAQYYNETGAGQSDDGIDFTLVVDEGADAQDVMDAFDELELPAMYEGLRFKGWDWGYFEGYTETANAMTVRISAEYENCIIRYLLDPICVDLENQTEPLYDYNVEALFCQVAEIGDTITIPGSFEGYDDVTYWGELQAGDTFTVDGDANFFGYTPEMASGDPEDPGTTPEDPDDPGTTPEEPENPGTTPDDPAAELPESSVDSIVNMVQNAADGETVNVQMGAATVVPKEVLEAAQGKDVTIELQMDGYTWTINGNDITASNLTDINLEVTLNSNAIPSSTVQKLAGDNPAVQLSLTHNGDFGFRASLTINVGSENAGKFGNLYYYDSDGRMVFRNAGSINTDGSVTLSFSHASDYVVVISDKKMSQADVPADLQPVKDSGSNSQNTGKGSVQTGDVAPIIPTVIVLILAAAVIAGVIVVKKRRR